MDDPGRIIVDISSDEDVGWGESGITSDGRGGGGDRDDSNCISEFFDQVVKETDDSDEVLMVGEVTSKLKLMALKSFAKRVDNEEEDDDDDDCVVLDGDPDKPVAVENDGGEDSDDLCVVAEKGQVACRDYPHPRHLCVKFPFNSTPHEKHCNQCHCYVCDSVAPCVHWGNGASSIDHCHATEKDEFWKTQRKDSKKGCKAPSFVSGVGLPPMRQVPSLPGNCLMRNQVLPASQPCSVTSTGAPNSVMPVRTQECGYNQVPSLPSNRLVHNSELPAIRHCSVNSTGRAKRPVRTPKSIHKAVPSLLRNPSMHNLDLPSSQPCSITSPGTPNMVMPMRPQVFEYGLQDPFQPHLVSQQLQRPNVGHAGTQFIPPLEHTNGRGRPPVPSSHQGHFVTPLLGSLISPVSSQTIPAPTVASNARLATPNNFPAQRGKNLSQCSANPTAECTQVESTSSQRPAMAVNLRLSPSSNPHQMDSQFNTGSSEDKFALEDLDIPLIA